MSRQLEQTFTLSHPDVAAVLAWWGEHARPLPWRARRDVYGVWVSEVMSAQTTVTRAADAWTRWMERWPIVGALAEASLADVLLQWQGLGYPRRARDLHRSARIVAASGWPEPLTELPGVGAYIAAAIRCFAREEPVLPLDVNVKRVLARAFRAASTSRPTRGRPARRSWSSGNASASPGLRARGAR